ncbi:MAG: UDP-galactopyranose mutase, partial [Gammaproteobacteria bacterium]|nr:UDP-galactopyranose mutase [Gammaproteobacteria bacterium]
MASYDAVVVGAGLSGAVMARQLAEEGGWRVLVVEGKSHIAGHCYDSATADGIYLHHYGPHIFHTDNRSVYTYLSRFCHWRPYRHRVLAEVDRRLIPLPFNLNSLEILYPRAEAERLVQRLLHHYGDGQRISILELRQSGEPQLGELAERIYQKLFRGYSRKQWGLDPDLLSAEVIARVPLVVSRDDDYFADQWQGIPVSGYSKMVEKILDHPLLECRLNTAMSSLIELNIETGVCLLEDKAFAGQIIYTGMVDALFGYCYGVLPYRTLRLETQRIAQSEQEVAVVNYPQRFSYTRTTQFGHFVDSVGGGDLLMREYPEPFIPGLREGEIPFYPVFTDQNRDLFSRYEQLA